jgi:hypothetical protein
MFWYLKEKLAETVQLVHGTCDVNLDFQYSANRMRLVGHVAHMGKLRKSYAILAQKPKG